MDYDAYGNPIKPKSSGVLLPVVLALLVSGGGNYWLWKERSKLTAEVFTATSKLGATEAVQKEMAEKLAKLEAEHSELVEAKEQAVKDAQAKALELSKLKDDVAGVESPESEAPEAADAKAKPGDKGDTKGEKSGDKKAAEPASKPDKSDKADKKADAKKAKAKAKKKAESHKKDAGSTPPADREL